MHAASMKGHTSGKLAVISLGRPTAVLKKTIQLLLICDNLLVNSGLLRHTLARTYSTLGHDRSQA
jgi:hypothetical protein